MKSCICCKHYETPTCEEPCHKCVYVKGSPNWKPDDHIAELIEAAERKAFEAGWEWANELCEIGGIHDYVPEDFEKWKEESK